MKSQNFLAFITPFLLLLLGECHGQNLTAVYLSPLPAPLDLAATYYDGFNTIYLIGGFSSGGSAQDQILVFDIPSGLTTSIGKIPERLYAATAQGDDVGNVFVFGGILGQTIYKFNPQQNKTEWIDLLPYNTQFATSTRRGNDEVLIFGGRIDVMDGILSFNMTNNELKEVGNLPRNVTLQSSVRVGDKAFIFGKHDPVPANRSFIVVNLETETFQSEVIESELPVKDYLPAAVFDSKGGNIYIIGGDDYRRTETGIVKFNPETYQWSIIPVNNFTLPNIDYIYSYPPATVYVERMNRIYFFGGLTQYLFTGANTYRDEVWYVDLNEINSSS